jgi:hypothetical protein
MTAQELSDYEQSQVDRFGIFAEEEANTRRLGWLTDEELRVELNRRARTAP